MSEMSEKAHSAFSSASKKIKIDSTIDSVSGKVAGVSEKLKGTAEEVPESTDELSNKIELFFEKIKIKSLKNGNLQPKMTF
jgi:uncharacterized protein YlzI (FlbEa/FlbD family)